VLVPEGEPGLTQPAGASDSPGSAPATAVGGGVLVKTLALWLAVRMLWKTSLFFGEGFSFTAKNKIFL
jgi:hypothetical protein